MTVLIKYPVQTKKRNKNFFERKNQELTNLDWAKWAGWFDTDGCLQNSAQKHKTPRAILRLKDKQPVELFSKTFESSLIYTENKTTTPEPYRYEYISQVHSAELAGAKATWFTKNIFPYLIKHEKKDYAAKLLGYRPESKDFATWTADEATHYLATAVEGDGHVRCRSGKKTKFLSVAISSSDVQYLSDVKYFIKTKLAIISNITGDRVYMTKEGIKKKYKLYICGSRSNPNNLPVFKNLIKDHVMTLDRKKQKIQEFVTHVS